MIQLHRKCSMKLGSKPKQQKTIFIRLMSVILLVCCALLLMSVYKRYQIEQEMADRRAVLEAERAALLERKDELEAEVSYLQDERSVEAEIRQSFDVAKEGEQVVVILDGSDDQVENLEEEPVEEPAPWYIFWR